MPYRLTWLAAYLIALVWITWPLAMKSATHLPKVQIACIQDAPLISWSLAYQSKKLVTEPSDLPHPPVFHPTRNGLFYGEAGFGALPFFAPVFLVTQNPALAANMTFLVATAATAWILHLIVFHWTSSALSGLIAGGTYLSSRWVLWEWPPCASNYAVLCFLPIAIALAAQPHPTRRRLFLLGGVVVAQGLVSSYIAIAVLLPLFGVALIRFARRSTRRASIGLLVTLTAASAIVAVPYLGYLVVRANEPLLREQTLWTVAGNTLGRDTWHFFGSMSPVAITFTTTALILLGGLLRIAQSRDPNHNGGAWRHAAYWAIVGTMISMPAGILLFSTETPAPLPQTLLADWLPAIRVVRAPIRLGVAGLFGLCLLAGLSFSVCIRTLGEGRSRQMVAGLMAAIVLSAMATERALGVNPFGLPRIRAINRKYPMMEMPSATEPLMAHLGEAEGPLLELPCALPIDLLHASVGSRAMYRSVFHNRPLINGYSGYWPRDYPARVKLAAAFPNREAVAQLQRSTSLTQVLVDRQLITESQRAQWEEVKRQDSSSLRLVYEDDRYSLFDVSPNRP